MARQNENDSTIRAATIADAEAITEIYNHYIRETVVTFEEATLAASDLAQRIEGVWSSSLPWLVAEADGQVAGYAYASRFHARSAYRYSAEITVYLAPAQQGRGLGSRLYAQLFPILKDRGIHAVIGGISLPNEASVALHEKFGLEKCAHYREVGYKFDRWIDVGYWQRVL